MATITKQMTSSISPASVKSTSASAAPAPPASSSNHGKGAGRQLNAQGNLIAGSISGLLSTCITNPFDTLRTRMGASRAATGVANKNLTAHIKSLFEGGILDGLGVGLKMNLISSVPSNAVYLTGYKFFNKEVRAVLGDRPVMVPFFSAMFAVMTTNGLLSPFFTIRTRVMLDREATIGGIAKSIMAAEGPRGFYRGALANTSGRIVEEATFWMLYESAMRWNSTHDSGALKSGEWFWRSFLILGTSAWCKVIGSAISYPYNVVMTHLREVDAKTGLHNHNHIGPTIKFVYANDGIAGFWKGMTPHLIRCALSKSTQIYFFEVGAFCVGATGAFNAV